MKPEGAQRLVIVPCLFADACAFVARHHRHHAPPPFHNYSLAVADEAGTIRGVAIVARPVARNLCDGWTLEVVRVATDGTPNACSALYAGAWRAARALGFKRLVTYTMPEEGGASLRAAGYRLVAKTTDAGDWSRPSRPRVDKNQQRTLGLKLRWEAT